VRVLVTGGRGKVGAAAVRTLQAAGHDVVATDLGPPEFERDLPGAAPYLQADLTDAGSAYALIDRFDAVVHSAAIPDPLHHPSHVVFQNNLMSALNLIEGCVRGGVARLVNLSSETVPGAVFGEGRIFPPYLPIDENTPAAAADPYGFAKETIERWCDRVATHTSLSVVSIRPSWVNHPGNYERNLGPLVREPEQDSLSFWAYTDLDDLAIAIQLACEVDLAGHEVVYVAQPDNCTGRPLADLVAAVYPDAGMELRDLPRPDASGIDSGKAGRLLGWTATRSWRDVLDEAGRTRPD
jgi:UDP-glucose 4-epimerase